jgi:hypothetical protein
MSTTLIMSADVVLLDQFVLRLSCYVGGPTRIKTEADVRFLLYLLRRKRELHPEFDQPGDRTFIHGVANMRLPAVRSGVGPGAAGDRAVAAQPGQVVASLSHPLALLGVPDFDVDLEFHAALPRRASSM